MTSPDPTPAAPEDAAFARFRRSGDPEALADVYDRLAPGLLRLAMKLLGDATAAEDALQATFVTAIESAARHDGVRPVRAWLAGILANQVRNQRKRAGRRHDPGRLPAERPAVDPHQDAVEAELQRTLQRHVRELPDAWQAPILLRVRDGLTAGEIARALDRPAGTIRSQLARGLQRLRHGLASALGVFGLSLRDARPADAGPLPQLSRSPRPPLRAALPGGLPLLGGLLMVPALLLVISLLVYTPASEASVGSEVALVDPPAAPAAAAVPTSEPVALRAVVATTAEPLTLPQPIEFVLGGSDMLRVMAASATVGGQDELPDPLGPIRVVVLDEQDEPVAGAELQIWADRDAFDRGDDPLRLQLTDATGACEVVLAGSQVFAVRAVGRASLSFGRNDVRRLQWNTEGDTAAIELEAPCRVTGLVLGPDGRPLEGAEVVISRSGGRVGAGEERTPGPLQSDAEGRFEAELPPFVSWRIRAQSGERRGPAWTLYGQPGSEHELELTVPGDWHIGGRVLDPRGLPVADAPVHLWRDLPDPGPWIDSTVTHVTSARRTTRCDADGRFDHRASTLGGWLLQAEVEGQAPGDVVSITLDGRQPSAQTTLLLRAPASIRGRVLDAAGEPLEGVRLRAHDLASQGAHPSSVSLPDHAQRFGEARATSAADGGFVLEGLHPDGRFDVSAYPHPASAFAPHVDVTDVRAGTRDLVLIVDASATRTARVHGRVVAAEGGEPVPHFEVRVITRTENGTASVTREFHDPEGRFSIDDLASGVEYALRITAIEAEPQLFEGLGAGLTMSVRRADPAPVALPWTVARDDAPALAVRLPRPGRLEVSAVDEHGAALILAQIHLRRDWEAHEHASRRSVRTDDSGRSVFGDLEPGPWMASSPGLTPQRVEVPAGGTTRITLRP